MTPPAPRDPSRLALQAFGRRLAEVRKERGLSQKAIAVELGVSDDVVSKYERGAHAPKIETLVRLRAVLAVSLDYLLAGVPTSGIKDARLLRWARAADQLPAEQRELAALALETLVQTFRKTGERESAAGGGT
ncbi:MAG TPA: helix-turn-helix transcriptional regulator [Thermoanaerobaculia bacterium]|nr:helix-turn-helix transcriptional regulator [Thermoanaerobaculia bacterium]